MLSRSNTFLILATSGLLAACGGDSTSPFEAKIDAAANVVQNPVFGETFENYTDPATLPTSGSASYDGYIGAFIGDETQVVGDFDMTANFATSTIDATASNFVDQNDASYGGTLTDYSSAIDPTADTSTDFTFAIAMDGTISGPDGTSEIDVTLLGDFFGDNYSGAAGIGFGTVVGGTNTDAVGADIDAEFVALQ